MDIIKENENYRVRLENDFDPQRPYDDGATPILCREFYYGSRFESFNAQASDYRDAIEELWNRFADEEVIERYLRIFHGAYSIEWDSSDDFRYLSFDTTAWRESVGLTEEGMDRAGVERGKLAEGALKEVMAWVNGEVYGYIIEKKEEYALVVRGSSGDVDHFDLDDTREEWIEEDSCWGYYGYDYAKEAALEAFERFE